MRRQRLAVLYSLGLRVWYAVVSTMSFLALVSGPLSTGEGWSALLPAAIALVAAVRSLRVGVELQGQTLIVRNLFITRSIALDSVREIYVEHVMWENGTEHVAFRRMSGRPVVATGLSGSPKSRARAAAWFTSKAPELRWASDAADRSW